MHVLEVWRYPVKSLLGERLAAVAVGPGGVEGDRRYGIFDARTGLGLTARRAPEMLFATARLRDDGAAEITLPDGSVAEDDAALSAWLGRPVRLRSSASAPSHTYEGLEDFEDEERSAWTRYDGAGSSLHEAADAAVSLVSQATLAGWDPRRFRSNLLVDGSGEDALVGEQVLVGDAVLDVRMRIERCVVTTRAQAGGMAKDLDVLRTIHRERDGCLAVGAVVRRPGTVSVGDELRTAW